MCYTRREKRYALEHGVRGVYNSIEPPQKADRDDSRPWEPAGARADAGAAHGQRGKNTDRER